MKKYISLFLCAALAFAACDPVKPDTTDEVYKGIRASVEMSSDDPIPAEGGQLTVTVHKSPAFTVSLPKTASWLSYSQADSVITFKASANNSAVLRFAGVSIIDADLKIAITNFDVTQAGTAKEVEPIVYKTFKVSTDAIAVKAEDTSAAFDVTADGVEWTISSGNPAFVATPASGNGNAGVSVSFPANTAKEVVTAKLTVSTTAENVRQQSFTVTITQEAFKDEQSAEKPAPGTVLAEWYFCKAQADALAAHFNEAVSDELADAPGNGGCYVEPNVSGNGRLEYYNGCDKAATGVVDQAHKRCKRAVGTYGEPCPYGTYKDDYILWTANLASGSPIAAGTKLHLFFALRPNKGFIMKYWLIEYLDGDEWKPALPVQDGNGFKYNVELFYTSGSGNETNTFIEPTVTLSKDTEAAKFRMTATSNIGADGNAVEVITAAGALRFSGEDCNANTPHYSVTRHPIIDVVE